MQGYIFKIQARVYNDITMAMVEQNFELSFNNRTMEHEILIADMPELITLCNVVESKISIDMDNNKIWIENQP